MPEQTDMLWIDDRLLWGVILTEGRISIPIQDFIDSLTREQRKALIARLKINL